MNGVDHDHDRNDNRDIWSVAEEHGSFHSTAVRGLVEPNKGTIGWLMAAQWRSIGSMTTK
jgi:hypothetical protein